MLVHNKIHTNKERIMKHILFIALTMFGYFEFANAYSVQEDKRDCDKGIMRGCSNIGYLYQKGKGVKKDSLKSIKYYTKACNGGYAIGCSNLGLVYRDGLGVKTDYKKAKKLFDKGCKGKDGFGCNNVGVAYYKGKGTKKN